MKPIHEGYDMLTYWTKISLFIADVDFTISSRQNEKHQLFSSFNYQQSQKKNPFSQPGAL